MATAAVMQPSSIPWWLVLLEGIAALILGFFLLTSPGMTTLVLVEFLGFYWMIDGIFRLVSLFVNRTSWGWKLAGGIIGIIAGLAIVRHPLWAAILVPTTLVYFIAFAGIMMGAISLYMGCTGAGWGSIIIGILGVLFGLLLLFEPFLAALSLPFVGGVFAIAGGIIAIVLSFSIKGSSNTSTSPIASES